MFLQVREGQEMKSSQLAKQIAFLTVKHGMQPDTGVTKQLCDWKQETL